MSDHKRMKNLEQANLEHDSRHGDDATTLVGGSNQGGWDAENATYTGSDPQAGQQGMMAQATDTAKDAAGKATERVKETAGVVTDQAKQTLGQATEQTKAEVSRMADQVRREVDNRFSAQKDTAAERIGVLARSLRQASSEFDNQDEAPIGRYANVVADQLDGVSNFLRERNSGDLLGEVQRFARNQPELFVAGSLAVGFLIGRFIKGPSSGGMGMGSGQRGQGYQGNYQQGNYQQGSYQGNYGSGYQAGYGSSYQSGQGYQQDSYQGGQFGQGGYAEGRYSYEGGKSAYETGPAITEGSDTDYPRYDPNYGSTPSSNPGANPGSNPGATLGTGSSENR